MRNASITLAFCIATNAPLALAAAEEAHDMSEAHAPSPASNPDAPSASPASVLAGPRVHAGTAAPSLVRRGFDAALIRLPIDPAEAALPLLDLDDDAHQRVLAILDKRAAAMDTVVLDNLDLLTEIQTAAANNQTLRLLQIASKLHRQFTAQVGDEPLEDHIASVIPTAQATRLRDLTGEYWTALVAQDAETDDPGRIESFVIKRRARLEIFGKDVERAFLRITMDARDDDADWERVLDALDLEPDQERRIRAMARDFYVEAKLNPSKEQVSSFLRKVYLELDAQQRTRLFSIVVSSNN